MATAAAVAAAEEEGGILTISINEDHVSGKRKHEQMVLNSIVDRNDEMICMHPPLGKPSKRSKSAGESRNTSSRKSKAVLDEDTFIDSLSHIIERDYFPELSKMKRHLRLLDAYDAGDTTTIRYLHNQILTEQRQGPTSSLSGGGATPGPYPMQNKGAGTGTVMNGGMEDEESAIKEAMAGMSVEQFMQSYTSEDNASFEILHEKDKEDWRKARHWAFECLENGTDGGKRAGMLMLYHIGGKVMTAKERQRFDQLVDGQKAIGDDRPNRVDTWKFRVPYLTIMTHETFEYEINLYVHKP